MEKPKIYTKADIVIALDQSGKPYDKEKILRAFDIADQAHNGQVRISGEPYISHPIAVAVILLELGMDTDTIVAALLHDVVEDTDVPIKNVEKEFGEDVALIVGGVTKLGKIPFSTREEQQAENVRNMLLAMAQDVRVIITKLADRLHNLRTLQFVSPQKQRDKARETMEVYAPIAHRLGISAIKDELEDRSLFFLDPVGYNEIEKQLAMRREERQSFLERIKQKITDRMLKENVKITLAGRVKSIYGIYRKVYMRGRTFDEIFDVYAVRIVVDNIADCYNVLGIVHDMFTPIPNRFKDYISTPKNNMYQSLHTTLLDKEGIPFEIQIRTWDMHYTAEYGIAAHWKYKAGVSGKDKMEDRLAWVRQLLETQQDSEDVQDIVRSIKTDIAPEEVYVFTPNGDVIALPTGATVIDFAYAIHTQVGNHMVGAKVDGRMVSLDFVMTTGMVVEILTSNTKTSGPNRDWLKISKTSGARSKIRAWFKKERREENITQGKTELDRELKRNMIALPEAEMGKFLLEAAKRHHFNTAEELFAAIGYGGVQLTHIIPRMREEYVKSYRPAEQKVLDTATQKSKKSKKPSSGVTVEGLDDCLIKFAKCCNPLPGDSIVGFVTRGYGVSIHKTDCTNAINSRENEEQKDRWVNAEWSGMATRETFKSTIDILAEDRVGMLADVSIAISNMHVPLHALIAKEAKDRQISLQITLGISDVSQLQQIITNLKKINGITSIERSLQ